MKTKEKLKKLFIICSLFLVLFFVIILFEYYFANQESYAKDVVSNPIQELKISQAKAIDLDEIIEGNTKNNKREEFVQEETVLEYITKYETNENLPKGMIQVVQEGREGKQVVTKKVTYENDNLISEEQISSKITKASVNKIVEVGGANYTSNYKVKKGDTLYVTADRLQVFVEPNEDTQKIATLTKGQEIELLEIEKDWYKISCNSVTGYVKKESTTYIAPNAKIEQSDDSTTSQSKSQLISKLSFDMALNKPSGFTLEQFTKVLTDSKDTNKIFSQNAQYFYYIEKQYNINGIFVASVGVHESAWGTSKIALSKNNLFGYGAYDSNPYNGAYSFSTYAESIDLIARVFVKYYLNPKGTSIYGGEKAAGTYYNGATLSGINKNYASDKNWANAVYNYMKYFYNKL